MLQEKNRIKEIGKRQKKIRFYFSTTVRYKFNAKAPRCKGAKENHEVSEIKKNVFTVSLPSSNPMALRVSFAPLHLGAFALNKKKKLFQLDVIERQFALVKNTLLQ